MNATHQLSFDLAELRFGDDELLCKAASMSLSARRSRRCPQTPHRPGNELLPSADSHLNLVIDKADNIRNEFVAVVERFHRQIMLVKSWLSDFHNAASTLAPHAVSMVSMVLTSFARSFCAT